MNAVKDFLRYKEENKEKVAFLGKAWQGVKGVATRGVESPRMKQLADQVTNAGLFAGAATGVSAGGTAAIMGAQKVYNAATAMRDFKGMMEWNEDLRDEDPRVVNQSFKTLRRFAPDFSKDPLVSGSFVRRMVHAPQGAGGIIQEAVGTQTRLPTPIQDAANKAISISSGAMKPERAEAPWSPEGDPPVLEPSYSGMDLSDAFLRGQRAGSFPYRKAEPSGGPPHPYQMRLGFEDEALGVHKRKP